MTRSKGRRPAAATGHGAAEKTGPNTADRPAQPTGAAEFAAWLEAADLAARTVAEYRRLVELFGRSLGVRRYSPRLALVWLEGLPPSAQHVAVAALSWWAKWREAAGDPIELPELQRRRRRKRRPDPLDGRDLVRLRGDARGLADDVGLALLLCLETGLLPRRDVLQLKRRDVLWGAASPGIQPSGLRVKRYGEAAGLRVHELSKAAADVVVDLLDLHPKAPPDAPLVRCSYQRMGRGLKSILPSARIRQLRHSFAVELLRSGATPDEVSLALGYTDVRQSESLQRAAADDANTERT